MASVIVAGDVSGTCTLQAPSAAGSTVLTLPVIAADTLAGIAATQTLTNKTLVAPALGTPASGVLTNCTGVAKAALPAGSVLQVVNFQTSAVLTGTTVIPLDNTIPQITEGFQVLSLAITPISATNKLFFIINLPMSTGVTGNTPTIALFQDSTANALAAAWTTTPTAGYLNMYPLNYFMTSGTTSSTTFTIRAGPSSATTLTINGAGSTQYLGGTLISSITIMEIAA